MRKIEQQMLAAIKAGRNWESGNTRVEKDGPFMLVYLHGNLIAKHETNDQFTYFCPQAFIDRPTRTTVSRLRALGIGASIHKGAPCVNGNPI